MKDGAERAIQFRGIGQRKAGAAVCMPRDGRSERTCGLPFTFLIFPPTRSCEDLNIAVVNIGIDSIPEDPAVFSEYCGRIDRIVDRCGTVVTAPAGNEEAELTEFDFPASCTSVIVVRCLSYHLSSL